MVKRSWHIHGPNLHRSRLPRAGCILALLCDHRVKLRFHVRVCVHGEIKVAVTLKKVIGKLHMVEASMRSALTKLSHSIFVEVIGGPEPRFKMRLPDERRVVPCLAQSVSDGWVILW